MPSLRKCSRPVKPLTTLLRHWSPPPILGVSRESSFVGSVTHFGIRETSGDSNWPERVPWKGWRVDAPETFRDLTLFIAMHLPPPDLSRGEPWTRERIELVVRRVVWETIGVQGFNLDDHYVRDLGVE